MYCKRSLQKQIKYYYCYFIECKTTRWLCEHHHSSLFYTWVTGPRHRKFCTL